MEALKTAFVLCIYWFYQGAPWVAWSIAALLLGVLVVCGRSGWKYARPMTYTVQIICIIAWFFFGIYQLGHRNPDTIMDGVILTGILLLFTAFSLSYWIPTMRDTLRNRNPMKYKADR